MIGGASDLLSSESTRLCALFDCFKVFFFFFSIITPCSSTSTFLGGRGQIPGSNGPRGPWQIVGIDFCFSTFGDFSFPSLPQPFLNSLKGAFSCCPAAIGTEANDESGEEDEDEGEANDSEDVVDADVVVDIEADRVVNGRVGVLESSMSISSSK